MTEISGEGSYTKSFELVKAYYLVALAKKSFSTAEKKTKPYQTN